LDPIQEKLRINVTTEFPDDWPAWRDHWRRDVLGLELNLRATLGSLECPLRKIQELKVGDTLELGLDAAGPVSVLVEDLPKIQGLMGARHGNAAVRITDDMPNYTEGENGER
jgi:flagellar motor switch protein FliM